MKKHLLLLLTAIIIASCSKSIDTPKKFEIIDIKLSSSKIILGQRNIFSAVLTDSTGNINYEWELFYNNLQIGKTLSGLDIKSVRINTTETGEYTLRLIITRGVSDKSTFEKKFISNDSNFQFGVWGNSEATIKTAESDNGYEIYGAMIGIPDVTTNNAGLTTLTYNKSGKYYTYYFKDGKLYAGAYTKDWSYVNQNTDVRSALSTFYVERANLNKILNTTLPESKIWRTPGNNNSSQIAYWDQNDLNRSQALILGYLELKTEGTTALGKGSLHLYNYYGISKIIFEYILVSPL